MSDLQSALQTKLEGLKSKNADFADREETASILASGESVSRDQLQKLATLRKEYQQILQSIASAEVGALTRAQRQPREPAEAEAILTELAAATKLHTELASMAQQAARTPERKLGDLTAIKAQLASGQGMAERIEARIAKLAA